MKDSSLLSRYISLAEAVIKSAADDYVKAAKYIQSNDFYKSRNKASAVHEYVIGKRFFLTGCNGLVGVRGDILLKDVNHKFGLNAELIEFRVKDLKSKDYYDDD